MVALCAAREGVSPVVYWHTRTPFEMNLSISAWVESWHLPARVLMGSGKDRAPADPTARRGAGRPNRDTDILGYVAPRYGKDGQQARRTVYDLRQLLPLDREWDPEQVQAMKHSIGRGLLGRGRGR